MVVYTVHTRYLTTRYKSTLCSKSTLFLFFATFWTFFLPLLLAYRSQGFWVKDLNYIEQPVVRYKNKYFLFMETSDESKPIICTSHLHLSQHLEEFNQCTIIKTNEADRNGDGKMNELHLEIETFLDENVSVQSITLLLFFDYILQHQCLLQMESLAVIQSAAPYISSKIQITGDLTLTQKSLLGCRGRDLRYNQSVFTDDDSEDINLDLIISEYAQRNVSTRLENVYSLWTRNSATTNVFIQANINYAEVTVRYRPGFWPVMKWAWIQYAAILIIFLTIFQWIKSYVFQNHLLPTVPDNPWRKNY